MRDSVDPYNYDEFQNFPTRSPGLDDYTAVCIGAFVIQPVELQQNEDLEFVDSMRLIEGNNFNLVENL